MAVPNVRGSWYLRVVTMCPACGRESSYRERRPGPRPDNPEHRVIVNYDHNCPCFLH